MKLGVTCSCRQLVNLLSLGIHNNTLDDDNLGALATVLWVGVLVNTSLTIQRHENNSNSFHKTVFPDSSTESAKSLGDIGVVVKEVLVCPHRTSLNNNFRANGYGPVSSWERCSAPHRGYGRSIVLKDILPCSRLVAPPTRIGKTLLGISPSRINLGGTIVTDDASKLFLPWKTINEFLHVPCVLRSFVIPNLQKSIAGWEPGEVGLTRMVRSLVQPRPGGPVNGLWGI